MINHRFSKLENEFQIISCPLKDRKIVYLAVFVRTGSNQEIKAERGFAHFTEHLVFKSTEKYPQNAIMNEVSRLGGSINAFTEYNSTCFYLLLPSQHLAKGLEILSQLTRWANFDQSEFTTEKGVVIEELYQYQNDPDEWFFENSLEHFFSRANYRYPIIGNLDNLQNSTPENLRKFYQQKYTPSNCFLVACGDIPTTLEQAVEEFFGSWQNKIESNPPQREEELNNHQKGYKFFEKDIEKDQINILFNAPAQSQKEYLSFMLATTILAEHQNSILQKKLKQELGIIDHLGSCDIGQATPGALVLQIFPQKESQQVLQVTQETIEDFAQNGCTYSQYQQALKILDNAHRFSLESCEDLGVQLGLSHIAGEFRFTLEFCDRVQKVTFSDVQATIKKHFSDFQVYHMGTKSLAQPKSLLEKKSIIPAEDLFCYQLFDNFKIVLKREPQRESCGVCLTTRSALGQESPEQLGIQSLCSHLLIYGNHEQSHTQFIDYCQENGLKFSINTNMDITSLDIKCFTRSLPEALHLLALTYWKPRFEPKQFDMLVERYLSDLQRVQDYPVHQADKLFKQEVFGNNSPFVHKKGTAKSLQLLDLEQIKKWHQNHFLPQEFVLSVVGDFDTEKIIPLCQRAFADFAGKKIEKTSELSCSIEKSLQIKTELESSTQDILYLVGAADNALNVKENTAFSLLSQIIGGSISSRMFDTLREKMGIAYSCGFSQSSFLDFGYYKASVLAQKGAGEKVLECTKNILQDMANGGVTPQELTMSKSYLSNLKLFYEEDPLNIACSLAHLELSGFGFRHFAGYNSRIEQTSAQDLQNVAQKYFQNFSSGIYCGS